MSLEIYSVQDDQISFAAEGFTSTLRNKILTHMSEVSDKVYIDTFDEMLDKYDNLYREQSKWNLLMITQVHISTLMLTIMIKILNVKLVIM